MSNLPGPADLPFVWLGNELCLDFHNTVDWHADGATSGEALADFSSLLSWCETAGIIDDGAARKYLKSSRAEASRVLDQALDLRLVIHGNFPPLAVHSIPAPGALDALNKYLGDVVLRLDWTGAPTDPSPILASESSGDLHPLLSPIIWSAASLLVSPYRERLGQCSNPECGRVYVDLSRRGNRRWCDMNTCGNRAKAQRHYHRHR